MFEMRPRHAIMTEVSKRPWMACAILKFSSCVFVLFLSLFSHKRIVQNLISHMCLNVEIKHLTVFNPEF